MAIRTSARSGWTVVRSTTRTGGRRGAASEAAAIESDIPAEFLQAGGVRVDEVIEVVPSAETMAERRAAPPDLELDVDLAPGEGGLLVLRHPSGAITFHPSSERRVRSGRRGAAAATASTTAVFRIPVRRAAAEGGRRGIVSNALKVVVVKVAKAVLDRVARVALPILASRWETSTWKRKGLGEGWFRVVANGTAGLTLTPGMPTAGERSLLLVHGTFSNANGAFGALARTDFFQRVAPRYGDRIFAFNHFTVSRTPEENARMLLEPLGAGERDLDAITHSRGGLVLRNIVEHGGRFGSLAARFRLGHAVLVASPNDGTPLATPARWQETVGWFANLMEVFPEHPLTTAAEWVAESIVWLASHLTGDLPGLRAMDGAGDLVAGLQSPPGPPAGAYSALVANYHPDASLWQRAVDVGVDQFFGSANDLVVPSEGGWRVDRDGTAHVPGTRIGCFGPGGNLRATPPVHHLGFFGRAETARFLAAALAGESHELPPIDPRVPLPDRRFTRGATVAVSAAEPPLAEERAIAAPAAAGTPVSFTAMPQIAYDASDAFHIVVLDAFESPEAAAQRERPRWARVLASYGGARVMASMRLNAGKGETPTAFGRIIAFHTRIRSYTNREKGTLPADDEMMRFGGLLFETLFQGDVRRLYDEARSRQRGRKLDLVLTSVIPWIAEKPWEFCYDTARASFLATEEIHFVRNVLTAVPADVTEMRSGPLRLLVAAAQPVGYGRLSIEQEEAVIRRGFQPLEAAGLLSIDLLPRATPEALHRRLESRQFDAVHFIGHGVFDEEKQEGCLVFENDRGGAYALGQRSVREIFCGRGLSLVFLNSCQSGTGGRADFNSGVAQSLVAHGLPALVANQYSVLDSSATSFAQYFYASLAQGHTLGHAAREARIAVNYSMQGELIDWAIPVLYARDPNRVLCAPAAAAAEGELLTVTSRARRGGTATRARRIAVWDVDMVFPAIEATLERMNAAQQVFGFELADISVPLDAWDRSSDTEYLQAERVARRLRARPVQLGVDLLACITSHWLRDDTDIDLYAWWPDDRDPAIGLLSSAGLKLDPEGPKTERAIVNTLVSVLAGFFAAIGTHESGAKSCPLAYNENRDLGHITGTQKFDAGCRRELRRSIPDELPALEALLAAFA